jgi:uncharacterized protein YaiE (UPF0345 family)
MFETHEYFDGKVKSLAFETSEGRATIGIMSPGEYEFGTSTIEYMTVTSGILHIMLPGETNWKSYRPFETFIVQKDVKFKVKTDLDVSYLCIYK